MLEIIRKQFWKVNGTLVIGYLRRMKTFYPAYDGLWANTVPYGSHQSVCVRVL